MLNIESIGGMCPVQAEGTVNGKPFYFRARWRAWEFAIAEVGADPVEVLFNTELGFYRTKKHHNAGSMPIEEARKIIQRCVAEYSRQAKK